MLLCDPALRSRAKCPKRGAGAMGLCMIETDKIDHLVDPGKPVLIYGPTATGKSGLALQIAEAQGGVIVNADALQIYQGWPVLTAQPPAKDLARVPHHLYGHLAHDAPYSAGRWLRDVLPFIDAHRAGAPRPIIVGGTGLYFLALTEGLADIPATPSEVRARGDTLSLSDLVAALDPDTAASIDLNNRARVQRAWEVLTNTGRGIKAWQDATPPPPLPLADATALTLMPDVEWLNARIALRFDQMIEMGALAEAEAMEPIWDPQAPSSKAIGAQELIDVVRGNTTIDSAREAIITATRQYAKRQRTWARSRMKGWQRIDLPDMARNTLST